MIYHDSNAVAFFGDQLSGNETPVFCGQEFRTNDITAAILREQLKKMDGILTDLRKNKQFIMNALSDCLTFAPSHDAEGDCGTTVAVRFETEEAAMQVIKKAKRKRNSIVAVYFLVLGFIMIAIMMIKILMGTF